MIQHYHSLFTQDELSYFFQQEAVQEAKRKITSQQQGSVYFSLEVPADLKAKLSNTLGLDLSHLDRIPMRWIKGDTVPHIDRGQDAFTNTYLAYLTDSPGSLVFGEETYPITQGDAYIFQEGLNHGTIGTGSEPRLLLGPMSEQGFAVGYSGSLIQTTGGSIIYIREDSGSFEYSINDSSYASPTTITFPCTIQNTNSSNGFVKVYFTTPLTFSSLNEYFICGSESIQFGSESQQANITINVSDFEGFIHNGDVVSSGYNNIRVYNLILDGTGGTLYSGSGWLGRSYFGKDATDNYILRCQSSGAITAQSGGILGSYAADNGTLTIIGCSSRGEIGDQGGGIVGAAAGSSSGNVTLTQCYTTGDISGNGAGGILGANCYAVTIEKCYSQGLISGANAGGIIGGNAGIDSVSITKCYTSGNITGANAGGICGSLGPASGVMTVTITNCYTTGNLDNTDPNSNGAICGLLIASGGNILLTITNCYTTGTVVLAKGYIIGNDTTINGINTPPAQYILQNNYSEAGSGGSPGTWSTTHANTVLQGGPSSNPGVGSSWSSRSASQPYELSLFGTTPYQTQTVSGTDLVQSFSQTIQPGNTSSTALNPDASGNAFAILGITGGDSSSYATITISQQTGAISTTSLTSVGTYTVYVRSIGSYNITLFYLTLTNPSPQISDPGCCNLSLDLRGIDYTTRAEVLSGNMILSILDTRRQAISYTDLLRTKQAKAFKR